MNKKVRILIKSQTQRKSAERSRPPVRDESEALEEVKTLFQALRVRVLPRPKKSDGELLDPVLPGNLTKLSDEALGNLLGDFAKMVQFIKPRMALKSVELAIQRRRERIIRAQVRAEKHGTVHDKDAQVDCDSRTREAGFHVLVSEGVGTMTDAVMEGYIIGRDTVSREITRRISLLGGDR